MCHGSVNSAAKGGGVYHLSCSRAMRTSKVTQLLTSDFYDLQNIVTFFRLINKIVNLKEPQRKLKASNAAFTWVRKKKR